MPSLDIPSSLVRRLIADSRREVGESDWRAWAVNVLAAHCDAAEEAEEREEKPRRVRRKKQEEG